MTVAITTTINNINTCAMSYTIKNKKNYLFFKVAQLIHWHGIFPLLHLRYVQLKNKK